MANYYVEFDSNPQALFQDLRTQILACADWARLTSDAILASTSAPAAAAATTLTFTSGTPAAAGLVVGMVISIDDGTLREYRTITAVAATTVTVAALSYAHASGTPVRAGNELYRATTTRGAQMVIDLNDAHLAVTGPALQCALYRSHDGTTGVGKIQRYLYWRSGAGAATQPLHVTLSLGKEHFFLSIEGPRPNETGAVANIGSLRNYIFMCDIVPYDAGDAVPVVFAGGSSGNSATSALVSFDHVGHVSRTLDGVASWASAKLLSLDFPHGGLADTVSAQRNRQIDTKFILAPYVVFQDDSGMRGRLSSFFFAGFNQSDQYDAPPPPSGSKVTYGGESYKLLPVNRGDGTRIAWNQFGSVSNGSATTFMKSAVVAVPCP